MSYLYRYETKGIQRWILDAGRLRELAGGSALIDAISAEARRRIEAIPGTEVIQDAAGGVTALFPGEGAVREFAADWPYLVCHWAPGLQVVQHWLEGSDTPRDHGRLRAQLADRRNCAAPELPEVGPWVMRTGRSGRASVVPPPHLRLRRPHGTGLDAAGVMREDARTAGGFGRIERPDGTAAVELDVDSDTWDEGPVAVIHIDGNEVGKHIARLTGPIREFSSRLAAATRSATVTASRHLPVGDHGRRQGRIVVLGGDDLTAVVPAESARRFAQAWIAEFELQTHDDQLTASAGWVYVNSHFPFAAAYDLAEALCKRAKDGGRDRSRMAFIRVTTSLADEQLGHAIPWRADGEALSALMCAVRELPRGALRAWLAALQDCQADRRRRGDTAPPDPKASFGRADDLWCRIREVQQRSKPREWAALEEALRGDGRADAATGRDDEGHTPLHDVLTLRQVERGADGGAEEAPDA